VPVYRTKLWYYKDKGKPFGYSVFSYYQSEVINKAYIANMASVEFSLSRERDKTSCFLNFEKNIIQVDDYYYWGKILKSGKDDNITLKIIDEDVYSKLSNQPIKAPPYWPREGAPIGTIIRDDENGNWKVVEDYFYLTKPASSQIKSIERVDERKEFLETAITDLPDGKDRLENQSLYRLLWYQSSENPNQIRKEGFKPGNKDFWGKNVYYFTNSARSASRMCYKDKSKPVKSMILARVFVGLSYQLDNNMNVAELPIYMKEKEKTYMFNSIFQIRDGKWYYAIFDKRNAEAVYIVKFQDKE